MERAAAGVRLGRQQMLYDETLSRVKTLADSAARRKFDDRPDIVVPGNFSLSRRDTIANGREYGGAERIVMAKLIFGCGYLGRRVAHRWLAAGDEVFAVTRSAIRAADLAAEGLRPIVGDLTDGGSLAALPEVDTVLFAIGYDRSAGKSIRAVYVDGLRNALTSLQESAALRGSAARFIYISSTGVFSQNDGQWVDEQSPCVPTREGGKACLAAENLLAEHPLGSRAIVLRMAGIYGPGRIPRRHDLEAGRPIAAPSDGYLNLIHVEDAADIVLAAKARAVPPSTYLVSDGHPVLRRDYYEELARLLGTGSPQFEEPPPDSPAAQRAGSDKRVGNARLVRDLAPTFVYPSYREGLAAIVDSETAGN
jgi:nucleoside-diphosphate-sugar epimerase